MTKPRRPRLAAAGCRAADVPDLAWRLLLDEPLTAEEYAGPDVFALQDLGGLATIYEQHHETVLAAFVAEHPGQRPSIWWRAAEPRQRLGGVGTPKHECLNYGPSFHLGVPDNWVDQWQADYYNGRARDVHGKPIGTQYSECHFNGVAPDPNDRPTYESQAAYLKRHGLLMPDEERRLTADDFEPEALA